MRRALAVAGRTPAEDVPVGAIVVGPDGRELAAATNRRETDGDPLAHAEVIALRAAARVLGDGWRLEDCTLVVTLEPCTMCAGAIAHARLRRVYYAADDPKGGAIDNGVRFFDQPTCHHAPEVIGGVSASRAAEMLRKFFSGRR